MVARGEDDFSCASPKHFADGRSMAAVWALLCCAVGVSFARA
jgi:hypothetical protein